MPFEAQTMNAAIHNTRVSHASAPILRSICHRRPQSSWATVSKSELTKSTHLD